MSPATTPICIGLGGNQGSDGEIVARFSAVASTLEQALEGPVRKSPIYRTAPMGPVADQPSFLNAVMVIDRPLAVSPEALLGALLDLETALGRDRSRELDQGPRPIDLDLLVVGDHSCALEAPLPLVLPHPGAAQRHFVLRPLADVLGDEFSFPGVTSLGEALREPEVVAQPLEQTDLHF